MFYKYFYQPCFHYLNLVEETICDKGLYIFFSINILLLSCTIWQLWSTNFLSNHIFKKTIYFEQNIAVFFFFWRELTFSSISLHFIQQFSQKFVSSLFRCCLQLIVDCPSAIQEELDLIRALGYLEEFGVKILPLQGTTCFYSSYNFWITCVSTDGK